jgi:hypothetical protein
MDPDEIEISSDAKFAKELEWQMRNKAESILSNRGIDDPNQQEIIANNRLSVRALTDEIQSSGHGERFASPLNPAQNASRAAGRIIAGGGEIVNRRLQTVKGSMTDADLDAFLANVEMDDSIAAEAIGRQDQSRESNNEWLYPLGFVIVGGLAIWGLVEFYKYLFPIPQSQHRLAASNTDEDKDLESNQTFLSLMMDATADQPLNATAFGVTSQTFGQLRQAFLNDRDNLSEDQFWSMQAEKSTLIFPATQKPFTLGDHLLALDFQFELLSPLYDSQPMDLDVDATISALADSIDLSAECPMNLWYGRVMEIIPETTGANRIQRIVLLRSGLARAIARMHRA